MISSALWVRSVLREELSLRRAQTFAHAYIPRWMFEDKENVIYWVKEIIERKTEKGSNRRT